ncbi:hypothetical protein IU433_13945 [Nocardia puris]|uniref:hypothetical protein n=1 Tax=Nocardia puris TaxID=208602 RepID=UPI0018955521|nr:hypothetical protein [Nocardia puris]MBF6460138.1 hypothetical protein [Nocardia puris]
MPEYKLDELWTAKQCADYIGVAPVTWRSYIYRPAKDHPAPKPVTKIGSTPLWLPSAVREWHENRPGSPIIRK